VPKELGILKQLVIFCLEGNNQADVDAQGNREHFVEHFAHQAQLAEMSVPKEIVIGESLQQQLQQ
jgi:hypothetical protein